MEDHIRLKDPQRHKAKLLEPIWKGQMDLGKQKEVKM
jgi:hypothetical protein